MTTSTEAKLKMTAIFDSPDPEKAVQLLPAAELYSLIAEIGPENSFELFQLATPEQARVVLDLDLWEEWNISVEETGKWLELIMAAGDDYALRLLSQLDQVLLVIFLKKTISVGGGLGDIINSEDFSGEWDHTFDETFFLKIEDSEQSEMVMRMLELLFNGNHRLYRSLLLGAENELLAELEETAYQFRTARLEDEGIHGAR